MEGGRIVGLAHQSRFFFLSIGCERSMASCSWPKLWLPVAFGTMPPNKKQIRILVKSVLNERQDRQRDVRVGFDRQTALQGRHSAIAPGFQERSVDKSTPKATAHAGSSIEKPKPSRQQRRGWCGNQSPRQLAKAARYTRLPYLQILKARYPLFRHDATLHVVETGKVGERHEALELLQVERLVIPAHGD